MRFTVFLLALIASLSAVAQGPIASASTYELPPQDNRLLLERELERRNDTRPPEFAVPLDVDLTPAKDGEWTRENGRAVWRLTVSSPGAESLNLGFSDFRLPPGAKLYLANSAGDRYGPFTVSDKSSHDRFWSPLLTGDRLLLELVMPGPKRLTEGLHIATVNHDFAGVASVISGDCNVDVNCGAADGFPEIDRYRDIIRSVGAYTINGVRSCTGFLVNNGNQNGRPYFLTADHCQITDENAASVVVYWNYQNSSCRPPDSEESGDDGDGSLSIFNTGAVLRASYPTSDMTLLELEEPVNPRAGAFFAGWSAERMELDGGISIHHPRVEEKRISFTERRLVHSTIGGDIDEDGNYLRVSNWDLGTTEGGSSGAPLFDLDGRARGHLFGGVASCSVDSFDTYGAISSGWQGGGTPSSQLSHWLDPCGSGGLSLDGLEQADLDGRITAEARCLTRCAGDSATFIVRVGRNLPPDSPITITSASGLDVTTPDRSGPGESFTVDVAPTSGAPTGVYPIEVTVGDTELQLALTLTDPLSVSPEALSPRAEATEVEPFVSLRWQSVPGATNYDLQLALDPDFNEAIGSYADLVDTFLLPEYPLRGGRDYYWRIRGRSACGPGPWSAAIPFETAALNCDILEASALPVDIPETGTNEVTADIEITESTTIASIEVSVGIEHSFVGDLSAALASPTGDTLELFRQPLAGVCPARDLYLVLSDDAGLTAEAFEGVCTDGMGERPVRTRSVDPLNVLIGKEAIGRWRLVVRDGADEDGGRITNFGLRICGTGEAPSAPDITLGSGNIISCSNAGGTATLGVPTDLQDPLLTVLAGDLELDNYTFTYDAAAGTMDVTFSAWTLVGPGTFPLSYVVTEADGSERRAVSTLTVQPIPEAARLFFTRTDSSRYFFGWEADETVDRYRFEISATDDFSSPLFSLTTVDNRTALDVASLPGDFFWRVVSENDCGSFPSAPSNIIDDLTDVDNSALPIAGFTLYPNPTRGRVHLSFANGIPRDWRAELFDANGRRLRLWAQLSPELDLGGASAGVYYLRLSGPAGSTTRKLFLLGN